MMKRKSLIVLCGIGVMVCLSFSLQNAVSMAADTITMRIGHVMASGHPYDLGCKKFKELIEAKTGNRVKVEIFPSATLGGERDLVEGTKFGTLEIALSESSITGTIGGVRRIHALFMPFLFSGYEQYGRFLEESPIMKELDQDLRKKGIRNIGWMTAGFHQIINRVKPVINPEDIKDLKMRMWESKGALLAMRSTGATVIPMAFPEVYTGLQQGVIDGLSNSYATFYSQKFYEVTKYVSIVNWAVPTMTFSMGEQYFKKLPDDIQAAVLECGKLAARYERGLYLEADKKYKALLEKESKLIFNEGNREAFQKKVAPYQKEWAELIGGKDSLKFIQRLVMEAKKY